MSTSLRPTPPPPDERLQAFLPRLRQLTGYPEYTSLERQPVPLALAGPEAEEVALALALSTAAKASPHHLRLAVDPRLGEGVQAPVWVMPNSQGRDRRASVS